MIIWNDKDSEFYVKNYGNHFSVQLFSQLISFKSDNFILDVGCGGGQLINNIVNDNKLIKNIYGIDPSSKMIELSNKNKTNANVSFIKGYAEKIEFKDNFFDIVLILNSIFHWENIEKGLLEITRVMKKNSIIYIGEERLRHGFLHGDNELKHFKNFKNFLDKKGFKDVIRKKYFFENEGFYFFSGKK